MIGLRMVFVLILIVATAFFVAAEFAFLRVRSSKIDQLILEGNKRALKVQKIQANIDGYLSACQLGITLTALGLGWLGESTMEQLLSPVLNYLMLPEAVAHTLSVIIAFAVITFLHVVAGELAPKTVAIQKAEGISLFLAGPMIGFYRVMYPFIWILNGSASAVIKLFGLKPTKEHEEVHSEEELRIILSESYQSGEINQSEYKYVNRIFNFDELLAREIMVPRVDMRVIDVNDSIEDIIKMIGEEQYTRYPVVNNDKDEVIGMLHVKELFIHYAKNRNFELESVIRPVLNVQETIPVKELLREMQLKRIPFTILKDEYGGTSGLVTIEDILEEIVGEIRDEFDNEEKAEVIIMQQGKIIEVANNVLISQVNEILHIDLENDDVDTIGGWLYAKDSELDVNSKFQYENLVFTIIEKSKNRYERIHIRVKDEDQI